MCYGTEIESFISGATASIIRRASAYQTFGDKRCVVMFVNSIVDLDKRRLRAGRCVNISLFDRVLDAATTYCM